jgi:hypothetical protein
MKRKESTNIFWLGLFSHTPLQTQTLTLLPCHGIAWPTGYITLALASAINYASAVQSTNVLLNSATEPSKQQQNYSLSASMITMIISVFVTILHLDHYTRLETYWIKAFRPKAKVELSLILFLILWWIIATWIQTSVNGIAGDGKGQYNLYFSTWACCWTSIWTLERWMVASGMASFHQFLASWPNRAPGWCTILFLSFCTLLCLVDLYTNKNDGSEILRQQLEKVGEGQWYWLLFVVSITIPCAAGFVIVEIFREDKQGGDQDKSQLETIVEGVIFLFLVLAWIPSVMVATTPGGVASLVGNTYFYIWATTVFVMETAVWWVHDWRKRIHQQLQVQQDEYRKIQEEVLTKSRGLTPAATTSESSSIATYVEESHENEQGGIEEDGSEEYS